MMIFIIKLIIFFIKKKKKKKRRKKKKEEKEGREKQRRRGRKKVSGIVIVLARRANNKFVLFGSFQSIMMYELIKKNGCLLATKNVFQSDFRQLHDSYSQQQVELAIHQTKCKKRMEMQIRADSNVDINNNNTCIFVYHHHLQVRRSRRPKIDQKFHSRQPFFTRQRLLEM